MKQKRQFKYSKSPKHPRHEFAANNVMPTLEVLNKQDVMPSVANTYE